VSAGIASAAKREAAYFEWRIEMRHPASIGLLLFQSLVLVAGGVRIGRRFTTRNRKARQRAVKATRTEDGLEVENHFRDRRRPKYLFSGLTRCGCCGGGYTMISTDLVGCAAARNKGTCSNRINIRRDCIEARVLNALRNRLMDPELFVVFCGEFTREVNQARIEAGTTLDAARREVVRIDRDLDRLLKVILASDDVEASKRVMKQMKALEDQKEGLERALADADKAPALLHPEMAAYYRQLVAELHVALQEENDARRLYAVEILRSLIDRIVLTPEDGELKIDVVGDLAGILTVATKGGGSAGKPMADKAMKLACVFRILWVRGTRRSKANFAPKRRDLGYISDY
jgi:site-specific DNA recombinase